LQDSDVSFGSWVERTAAHRDVAAIGLDPLLLFVRQAGRQMLNQKKKLETHDYTASEHSRTSARAQRYRQQMLDAAAWRGRKDMADQLREVDTRIRVTESSYTELVFARRVGGEQRRRHHVEAILRRAMGLRGRKGCRWSVERVRSNETSDRVAVQDDIGG
jgi:hypothetical protein